MAAVAAGCCRVCRCCLPPPLDLELPPVASRSVQGHVEFAGFLPPERRGRTLILTTIFLCASCVPCAFFSCLFRSSARREWWYKLLLPGACCVSFWCSSLELWTEPLCQLLFVGWVTAVAATAVPCPGVVSFFFHRSFLGACCRVLLILEQGRFWCWVHLDRCACGWALRCTCMNDKFSRCA